MIIVGLIILFLIIDMRIDLSGAIKDAIHPKKESK